MDSGGTGKRGKPYNKRLDLLAEIQYQVRDLVYDDNKVRHLVSGLAVVLDVSASGSGKRFQTFVHLAHKPAENIYELGTAGFSDFSFPLRMVLPDSV